MTDLRAHWLSVVDSGHALLDFMTAGGVVMWALAGLCVLYWTLVFEPNPAADPGIRTRNCDVCPVSPTPAVQ